MGAGDLAWERGRQGATGLLCVDTNRTDRRIVLTNRTWTPAQESNSIGTKLERWIDMRNMFQGPKLGRSLKLAIAAFLVLPFLGSPVLAQRTTASVAGSIVDATGATVPAAQVLLRNLSTGAERTVETNELGIYVVTALPAGPYSLTVKKAGFQTQTVSELVLVVDQNASINLTLKVGAITEAVNVAADAPAIDTRTDTLSTVINQRQITHLPLHCRNLLQLIQLT